MTNQVAADTGGESNIIQRSASGEGPLSAMDAARALIDARRKDNAQQRREEEQPSEINARAQADMAERTAQESADEADTAGPQDPPGETQEADAEAETLPPIEPPRSWTKEDKELWK